MELTGIRFPPGSKAISAGMNPVELLKSLKRCCKFFSQLEQDQEEEKKMYLPFCRYIAEGEMIQDITDNNARIHLGCIFADIFRLHAPDNPFQGVKVKEIFLFLNEQLAHLKDTKSTLFPKAYHILENVATVKSYNICIELDSESSDEVFCGLFKTFFSIVNSGHDAQLKAHMLDVMSFVVSDSGLVTQKLLDSVLECLLEKTRKMNPSAHSLARELLRKTAHVVEPVLMVFFQNVLLDEQEKSRLAQNWPQLISELYKISPTLLLNTIPQLELKLRTDEADQRLRVVRLLARMFADKESDLASQYSSLWNCFLCRFNDIDPKIRGVCVNFCSDMIINHGGDGTKGQAVTKELISYLKLRRHDTEEDVRVGVVVAIRGIAMQDFQLASDEVLGFLKERLLDKKHKVRDSAIRAVADIYKKYSFDPDSPRIYRRRLNAFKSQLLRVYYTQNVDDCILLERTFVSSLIPYGLPSEERMKQLIHLYCTVDEHAVKAVVEMFKKQKSLREALRDVLEGFKLKGEEERNKKIWPRVVSISTQLQTPLQARANVKRFVCIARDDAKIQQFLEYLLSEQYTCQKVAVAVRDILKKLDADGVSKAVKQTTQQMLEKLVLLRVLIDSSSMLILMKHVRDLLDGVSDIEDGSNEEVQIRGMDLLQVLAFQDPHLFAKSECLEHLLTMLRADNEVVVEKALVVLRHTSFIIEKNFTEIRTILLPELKALAKTGTPKQAKYAISCINTFTSVKETPLMQVFHYCKDIASEETPPDSKMRTLLMTLGCVAECLPEKAGKELKGFIASTAVKKIIMKTKKSSVKKKKEAKWCPKAEITQETAVKIAAMKCMVRWLCGLNSNDLDCCGSTLRLLQHMMHNNGDLMKCGQIPKADMAHLRLQAAVCVLKIAKCSEYKDLISMAVYQELAFLLTDEIVEVRRHFLTKLYQALFCFQVHISFLSLFCMVSQEKLKDDRDHGTALYHQLVNRYREAHRWNTSSGKFVHYILPEYVLSFVIHMLANDSEMNEELPTKPMLSRIKEALNFILDPLLTRDHPESFGFIKRLAELIKRTKCQDSLDDPTRNETLYAVCDLVLQSVYHKSAQYAIAIIDHPDEAMKKFLPRKLYTKLDTEENHVNYLPKDFHVVPKLVPTIATTAGRGGKYTKKAPAAKPSSGISGKLVAVSKVTMNNGTSGGAKKKNTNTASPDQRTSVVVLSTSPEPSIGSFDSDSEPLYPLPKSGTKRTLSDRHQDESSSDDECLAVTKTKMMLARKKQMEKNDTSKKPKPQQPEAKVLSSQGSSTAEDSPPRPTPSSTDSSETNLSTRPKRASAGKKMFDFLQSTKKTPTRQKNLAKSSLKRKKLEVP